MATRTSKKFDAAKRAEMALQLRLSRVPFEQIAQRCGYSSRGAAYTAIKREIDKIPREAAADLLFMTLERLDQAEAAIGPDVTAGKFKAIETLIKIIGARLKVMGVLETREEGSVSDVRLALTAFLGDAQALNQARIEAMASERAALPAEITTPNHLQVLGPDSSEISESTASTSRASIRPSTETPPSTSR